MFLQAEDDLLKEHSGPDLLLPYFTHRNGHQNRFKMLPAENMRLPGGNLEILSKGSEAAEEVTQFLHHSLHPFLYCLPLEEFHTREEMNGGGIGARE